MDRATISGEDTLQLVQEDISLLLSHTSEPFFSAGYCNVVLFAAFNVNPEGFLVLECMGYGIIDVFPIGFTHTCPPCFWMNLQFAQLFVFLAFL